MEESGQQLPNELDKCRVCGSPQVEQGYRNKMCADCRTRQSRFPVPQWVQLFAAGIILLVVIDIPKLPKYFKAQLHYERGIKAQDDTDFVTAGKEFSEVADVFPAFLENNLRLMVCCEKNLDFDGMDDATDRAQDQESDDHELISEANSSMAIMNAYRVDSPVDTLWVKMKNLSEEEYEDSLKIFNLKHSDNTARYTLANEYYGSSDFTPADSLVNLIIRSETYDAYAISLKAAIKSEEQQYDSALRCYDYMLGMNHELIIPLNGKARVYVKMGNYAEALKYAQKAYSIDSANPLSLEAMAVVSYFQNRKEESTRFLSDMKKMHTPDSVAIERTEEETAGNTDTTNH